MKPVSRYHPLLVTLHWLVAFLIITMLGVGFFLLGRMPNDDPRKIGLLLGHMSLGMFILLLMLIRLVVRMRSARPAAAKTGFALLDRLGPLTHYTFYGVVILVVASGFATAIIAGLTRSVFQHSGEALPAHFGDYPTFKMHALLTLFLAALVILHVLAALWHQFVRKDGLFRRMGFGKR